MSAPQQSLALDVPDVDLSRLVRFTPHPMQDAPSWAVHGGGRRWAGRTGRQIGVVEIRNARAHGIVLDFGAGDIACFHPMDLFPARSTSRN